MKKPVVLIYYAPRIRSPTSTELYDYLESNCKDIVVKCVRDTPVGVPIQRIAETYFNGVPPDIVFDGFGAAMGSVVSWEYIKENKIGLVRTVGDVESQYPEHISPGNANMAEFNAVCEPDILFVPGPGKNSYTNKIKNVKRTLITLANAEIVNMPMPVSSELFDPKETVKDIAFSFVCTVSNPAQFGYHLNRERIYQTLKRHPELNKVLGAIYEREPYVDTLKRTKIFVAETSMRGALVYKYIEAALAGCLLIAEKPQGVDDLFVNGETFVQLDMKDIETDLPKKIDYYLKHDKERVEIANKMMKKMREYADMDKGRETFEQMMISLAGKKKEATPDVVCGVCGNVDTMPNIGGMTIQEPTGRVRVCSQCWVDTLKDLISARRDKVCITTGPQGSTSSETAKVS
jgi:hypothetical protein